MTNIIDFLLQPTKKKEKTGPGNFIVDVQANRSAMHHTRRWNPPKGKKRTRLQRLESAGIFELALANERSANNVVTKTKNRSHSTPSRYNNRRSDWDEKEFEF